MKTPLPTIPFDDLFGKFDESQFEHGVPDASSGDGVLRTAQQCEEWASSIGCSIKYAADNQLVIDLDIEAAYAIFEYQIKLFRKHFYYIRYTVTPSKQGLPHRHVVVELGQSYPLVTRIAMQSVLGSDPTRELLSVRRALDEEENVVIFFEKEK
jgi:hypothetical protein